MKPMLAKKYSPSRLTFPCYIQRKLDGVRAISLPGQPTLQSRPKPPDYRNIHWQPNVLPHIDHELTKIRKIYPGFVFDGELYRHGLSLQQINSRVAVKRTSPHRKVTEINYVIFDIFLPTDPFLTTAERSDTLHQLLQCLRPIGFKHIRIMPLVYCPDTETSDRLYNQYLSDGYEGAIYRQANAPYTTHLVCNNKENRTWAMQKRKQTLDIECTIVGLQEGTGRLAGTLGSFLVTDGFGKTFSVGTGLTDADRKAYWNLGQECIGATIRVTFRRTSDSGHPLEPRVECIEL